MRGCSGDSADLLTALVLVEAVAGLGGMIAYGYITYLMSDVLKGLARDKKTKRLARKWEKRKKRM